MIHSTKSLKIIGLVLFGIKTLRGAAIFFSFLKTMFYIVDNQILQLLVSSAIIWLTLTFFILVGGYALILLGISRNARWGWKLGLFLSLFMVGLTSLSIVTNMPHLPRYRPETLIDLICAGTAFLWLRKTAD